MQTAVVGNKEELPHGFGGSASISERLSDNNHVMDNLPAT